jgi:pimeloyl-ACP methyl ester carboxylesterase
MQSLLTREEAYRRNKDDMSIMNALFRIIAMATLAGAVAPAAAQKLQTGYVATPDGVRLYYAKVGNGRQTVIIPGRLFLLPDFLRLTARGRTLIFYDMRNRGLSDTVADPARIGIQNDVEDLEAVRSHFHAEKPDLIGFSYLGMMVVDYATQHPGHVGRIVQLAPVARKFGTRFPATVMAADLDKVPDPAELKKLDEQSRNGYAAEHPKEYCEAEWKTDQQRMVCDPAKAQMIRSPCDMPNEWPTHLGPHFQGLFRSIAALDIPKEAISKLNVPVLTIHGTRDRNVPYGSGRQWDLLLCGLPESGLTGAADDSRSPGAGPPPGSSEASDRNCNARLITVQGAAHMSWIDEPELVFSSIDTFLNGHWPKHAEHVTTPEPRPTAAATQ